MGTFRLELDKLVAKTQKELEDKTRLIIFGLGARMVDRSPVGDPGYWKSPPPPGYIGGQFKANWQYGFNSAPAGNYEGVIDPSGEASLKRIRAGVYGNSPYGIHFIINRLPYAWALENGWSPQAPPQGIVGLTVMESKSITFAAVQGRWK